MRTPKEIRTTKYDSDANELIKSGWKLLGITKSNSVDEYGKTEDIFFTFARYHKETNPITGAGGDVSCENSF